MTSFTYSTLTVTWTGETPWSVPVPKVRLMTMYPATLTIATPDGSMFSDHVRSALNGLVVESPMGGRARIHGIEAFATLGLKTGARIGVWNDSDYDYANFVAVTDELIASVERLYGP